MSFFKKLFGSKPPAAKAEPAAKPSPPPPPPPVAIPPPLPPVDLSRAGQLIDCTGVDWNEKGHEPFVRDVLMPVILEVTADLANRQEFRGNPHCSDIDAAILYGMLCHFQPTRMMEVGAGYTTLVMALARKAHNLPGELISVDPSPSIDVTELVDAHLRRPVQSVPVEDFQILQAGELLFIDSTHVYTPGGEVDYLVHKVLPKLNSGVLVGFHGIRLPREYGEEELKKRYAEQQHLLRFLKGNNAVEILFSGGWMAENCHEWFQWRSTALWFRVK